MPEPLTIVASLKRRGALKCDVGEGGTLLIEFPESEAANAVKALSFNKTFFLTFTERIED